MFPTDSNQVPVPQNSLAQEQPQPEDMQAKTPNEEDQPVDPKTKKRWSEFRQRIQTTKAYRKKLIRNWTANIDFRRGKQFSSMPDDDTVAVNLDWSFTKTKQAALFSQIPEVHIAHSPESVQAGPWLAAFERKLNDTLKKAGIESTMDEVLPDCINAAGIGIALVSYEALTEPKEVPSIDIATLPPQLQAEAMQSGTIGGHPIPTQTINAPVDKRYTVRRISPADFLWPIDFTGSDFDNAPWLGYTGRMPWAEAQARFGLADEDKDKLITEDRTIEDRLTSDIEKDKVEGDNKVGFDEIFYHTYQYDADAKTFGGIHHLVFLHGRTEPVIDEPWHGQIENDQAPGKLIGAMKKPVRVLTLTYVSDEDIPPSDSAVGRAQVVELNKGRTHMNKQRARNAPWTWFDVNRLDPAIQTALMRGTWQHAIPVQGDGSRIIGAVQAPPMHQENFEFDQIAKADLQELWTIGTNQLGGGGGVETRGEANVIQSNFQTKVGRERARVASFFVGIAQVLGGLMCLYEDTTEFGQGFDPTISEHLSYSIVPDSTVLLDSNQRLDKLNNFLNLYAKSGWVNLEVVLKEIATLSGLDPNTVIVPPQPQQPEQPNISLRLTGGQDMMNPLLLAFMIKAGQAPEPQLVEQAKQLINMSVQMQPPAPPGQMPGAPPPAPGDANPQMGLLPAINRRAEDGPTGSPATGGTGGQ